MQSTRHFSFEFFNLEANKAMQNRFVVFYFDNRRTDSKWIRGIYWNFFQEVIGWRVSELLNWIFQSID